MTETKLQKRRNIHAVSIHTILYTPMKTLLYIIMLGSFGMMQAQNLESVLSGYYKAIGGLEKYSKQGSVIIKAQSQGGGGGQKRPITFTLKRPNSSRMDLVIQPGLTYTMAYDGNQAWSIQPWTGSMEPQPMNADDARDAGKTIKFMWNDLMLGGADGTTLSYEGKDEIEGSEVYKIMAKHADGTEIIYYLDIDSYLIIKWTTRTMNSGVMEESDMFLGEYEVIDGRTLPFAFESKSNGETMSSTFVKEYQFNASIDDAVFTMPKKQ
jgi:outer membrane lipoprotein-sorting protein